MQLDDTEIDMLLKSLDALEQIEGKDMMMGAMLGTMLARTEKEAKSNLEAVKNKHNPDKALNESITLLKGKLIQMRPSRVNAQRSTSKTES